jgi:hypothetical protein
VTDATKQGRGEAKKRGKSVYNGGDGCEAEFHDEGGQWTAQIATRGSRIQKPVFLRWQGHAWDEDTQDGTKCGPFFLVWLLPAQLVVAS